MIHLRRPVWEVLSRRLIDQLPRSVKVAYRQLSTAAMNMAAIPRAQDFLVVAIAQYISDPAVQVITSPAGLLDRLPTRQAARLVLEIMEKPQTKLTYETGVWLATQKVIRKDFDAAERTELDMLILKTWRRDPAQASVDLAELIAELPEGMRSTLVQASAKAGRHRLGYVVQHGEETGRDQGQRSSPERSLTPPAPGHRRSRRRTDDRMLPRLVREALFHRDSERRHLASLLLISRRRSRRRSPTSCSPGSPRPYPEWMQGPTRHAGPLPQQSTCHRMRLRRPRRRPVRRGRHSSVIQGDRAPALNVVSDQALRNSLAREWSTTRAAPRCTRWACPDHRC
jgi:hypothetical protein